MRALVGSIASLFMMLVIGCNTVDPDECWVNTTSSGFVDDGPIPIGAGVGSTSSGDFGISPGAGPLAAEEPNPCMAGRIVIFKPSEFPFVTTIPDDGTGPGGGWQVATPRLEFNSIHNQAGVVWFCTFNIEMPLRTEKMGKVSASRAADLSVEITEKVALDPNTDYSIPSGIFCSRFILNVDAAFASTYPFLGARAKK